MWVIVGAVAPIVVSLALLSLVPTFFSVLLWIVVAGLCIASLVSTAVLAFLLVLKLFQRKPAEELKRFALYLVISVAAMFLLAFVNNTVMPAFSNWCTTLVMK